MTPQEAIFVKVDDWDGLYIDGKLAAEGDSMYLPDELDGLTVHFSIRSGRKSDELYVQDNGGFPDDFSTLFNFEVEANDKLTAEQTEDDA